MPGCTVARSAQIDGSCQAISAEQQKYPAVNTAWPPSFSGSTCHSNQPQAANGVAQLSCVPLCAWGLSRFTADSRGARASRGIAAAFGHFLMQMRPGLEGFEEQIAKHSHFGQPSAPNTLPCLL
jgi:hypothetical protein